MKLIKNNKQINEDHMYIKDKIEVKPVDTIVEDKIEDKIEVKPVDTIVEDKIEDKIENKIEDKKVAKKAAKVKIIKGSKKVIKS